MKKSIFKVVTLIAIVAANLPAYSASDITGRYSLGYYETTGNTKDQKVNFKLNLADKKSDNLSMQYDGSAIYGKSFGETNADQKKIAVTSEFIQSKRDSFYLRSGYLADRFAGYDQRISAGIGYLRAIFASEQKNLRTRVGAEFTREEYTDSTSQSMQWLKLGFMGDQKLRDNLRLKAQFDFDAPRDDYQDKYEIDFVVGAIMTVTDRVDLELNHSTYYKKTPVVMGKLKTDSTFMSSLVYKL